MTAIDVLTQKLVALGATTEMIVLVVEAVTVARDGHKVTRDTSHFVTPETTRVAAKMRKRKQRENERLQRLAATEAQANDGADAAVTVTRDTCDMSQNRCDLLPSSTSSLEVAIDEGSKKKRKKEGTEKCARASRMQAATQISPHDLQFALDAGMTAASAQSLWIEFVDFWIGVPGYRGVKSNWPATWRNRVRAVGAKGSANGQQSNGNRTAQGSRSTGQDAILAGVGRIADRIRQRGDAERREREMADGDDTARGDDAQLL